MNPLLIAEILYRDLVLREQEERRRLANRKTQLERTARGRGANGAGQPGPVFFSTDETAEHARISAVLKVVADTGEWCDPLFVAARDILNGNNLLENGLETPAGDVDERVPGAKLLGQGGADLSDKDAADTALVLGLLMADAAMPPRVRVDATAKQLAQKTVTGRDADGDGFFLNVDAADPAWPAFNRAFFEALGEARAMAALALRVLEILAREGDRRGSGEPYVDMAEFARVMRELRRRGVDENERQLSRRVGEALDRVQQVGQDDVTTEIGIDLPDLEAVANNEIVADNVRLMGPVICAAMLDELKAFQVVDWMLESAQSGSLPISGRGKAGKLLYKRWKEAPNRISEVERRNLYALTMGQPGGSPTGKANREFNDLWLRFVSSVSAFVRQHDVDKLLRASVPSAIGHQQVRKAARDLSINLSLHGYGMTYYSALELQSEVKGLIELLQDEEIRSAFGAKDMWQVIDQVATLELGGARTSSRYRTLATCGAIITAWLANHVEEVMRPMGTLIDIVEVRSPMPRTNGKKATTEPTDYDLVNACELWLADTGTSESRIEELSQPRETPTMTSKPVQLPGFARELMQDLPELPGMSFGVNGRAGQRMRH